MSSDAFYFSNGNTASTVSELYDILMRQERSISEHHISAHRNDFAAWVRHVFGDEILARKLEKARSLDQVISILGETLAPTTPPPLKRVPVEQPAIPQIEQPKQTTRPTLPTELPKQSSSLREFLWGLVAGMVIGVLLFQGLLLLI